MDERARGKSAAEGENGGGKDVCGQRKTRMERFGKRVGEAVGGSSVCMGRRSTAATQRLQPEQLAGCICTRVSTVGTLSTPFPLANQAASGSISLKFNGCVFTMSMFFITALLFRVWLAVAIGYSLGSAPGQDPGPRAFHH